MYYIKKPIKIQAIQWKGDNFQEIADFMKNNKQPIVNSKNELIISTLEGDMHAPIGAYIVCGVTGSDFYPCAKEVFEQSYIQVKENNKVYNLKCDNCGEIFTTNTPKILYDCLGLKYKYWDLCPFCGHKAELEIEQ